MTQVKKSFASLMKGSLLGLMAGVLVLTSLSACSEIAPSDQVGLWYAKGQLDGDKFDHCVPPGVSDDVAINDQVYWVPNNLRTWNIAAQAGPGVDSTNALVITAKPDAAAGQTSGLEVNIYVQVTLMLNTFCGNDEKAESSPFVQWWQKIGKRYSADTADGWLNMLGATVIPALEKAKNTLRDYTADDLVRGTVWAEGESKLGLAFSNELARLSGGDFFCGPDFVRGKPDCSDVAVSIKGVDYSDPQVQAARNEKVAAVERAQAAVAEAKGKLAAAEAQNALYQNEAWMELELAKLELQKAQACASAGNCTIVLAADGTQIHTGGR